MRFSSPARLLALAALPALLLAGMRGAPGAGEPTWLAPIELASGGGAKGPWRQNDSRYDYVDDGTAVFLPGGALAVAWVDQRRKEVLLQLRDADGRPRGDPVDVSRTPATFSWMPRLAAGGPDTPNTLYVLWQEIVFSGGSHGGDILFARSRDGGRSFSAPLNLSDSRGGDGKGRLSRDVWSNGSLDIAAGPDGSVLAAWTDYEGVLWLARSRDGGRGFLPARRIAGTAALPARGPALAAGANGAVHLAWTVGEDADADIRLAASSDGGASFGEPVRVGAAGARADAPRLALDGRGRLHLAYMESAGRGPAAIRYARAGRAPAFGAPRTLSGPGEDATAPQLAVDGRGRVHVVWEPAARSGLRHVVDAGAGFGPPALIPGSVDPGGRNGSQQGILGSKLAASADGAVAVVNSSLVPGQGSRVWLMRAVWSAKQGGKGEKRTENVRLERVKGIEPSS